MQSIEGKRGMPRSRPPFPAISGLFGKPTNINNVETLASVSAIMEKGGSWYAGFGTEKSKGTKTFALAGKINRTGLIEVPMGIPLRTIIEEIGGGVPDGKKFKAVQTGGPSGGCIHSKNIDLPVDYEHLAAVGSIMGSGGMIVIDEESCMVDVARYFLTFTESESCGKCVPCRMGTQHLLMILTDIAEGRGSLEQIDKLRKIGDTLKKGSLCGLGQTAPNPVLTTLSNFEDEYRTHIEHKKCPAGVCRELISFRIDPESCTGCRACAQACPAEAIQGKKKEAHRIDAKLCIRCGSCRQACKFGSILVE
jgi:NADH:ubiquinone oxidoreductase subunit F (NADH-binding)/NAD-dependent dihydropyrimidine dehydrogenase PreA subunit